MKKRAKLILICLVIVSVYLQHFQLTYSSGIRIINNLTIDIRWQLMGTVLICLPFLLCMAITASPVTAVLLSDIIVTIYSIINYYVFLFHGSPLVAGDILSFGTAMNVIGEYHFTVDKMVLRILLIFLVEILIFSLIVLLSRSIQKKALKVRRVISISCIMAHLGCTWLIFLSPWALFQSNLLGWNSKSAINEYGYEIPFLNSIYALNHYLVVPEGFDSENIQNTDETIDPSGNHPDIILVLNETLADLSVYSDIPEGKAALEQIYSYEGVISGYTTVSLVGGGTNNSEYELLTSNSMRGLAFSAPFQYLNMKKEKSIVKELNDFGYRTAAMHCGNKSNYSRNKAYYDMSFDEVYLGKDEFTMNKYGNRPWLDSDNYDDLLNIYSMSENEDPQFMYLLTYQNHGGYEQNDSNLDTIEVEGNYGDLTDDLNEYLTSIQQSSEAFCGLLDRLAESKRDVIVLMVGDHAPSFVSEISDNEKTGLEKALAERAVPYFVWSNFDIQKEAFNSKSTMVDLLPMLMKSAGIPYSSYYSALLDLNRLVPVRSCIDVCEDANGNVFNLTNDNEFYDQIMNYYYMEYSRLLN